MHSSESSGLLGKSPLAEPPNTREAHHSQSLSSSLLPCEYQGPKTFFIIF